ncbi:CLUMA_CG019882, isoform A [Clunio marinus]|uniref:CLUMA_CG019882, isoform A n=1 Tax=Clunio marinus TaxID=568069 RepID=A0A1J1J3T8_9DIPT|nr:CLUMA_CG019882, isoform A [Clunio marinus]
MNTLKKQNKPKPFQRKKVCRHSFKEIDIYNNKLKVSNSILTFVFKCEIQEGFVTASKSIQNFGVLLCNWGSIS